MPTTIDWPTYQGFFTTAIDALTSGDFLSARRAALQAKMVALGMGASVSASGTNVQLLVNETGALLEEITELEKQTAMKTAGGRLIRTGLRNGGRGRHSDGSGVLHD